MPLPTGRRDKEERERIIKLKHTIDVMLEYRDYIHILEEKNLRDMSLYSFRCFVQ